MTKNVHVVAVLFVALLGCESDRRLALAPGGKSEDPQSDRDSKSSHDTTTLTSYQPLLEGRKYRVQLDTPLTQEFTTFDIDLDRAPSVDPPVPLPGLGAPVGSPEEFVKYSQLLTVACAAEITNDSDIIAPAGKTFDYNGRVPNPGTAILSVPQGPDEPGELHRPKPTFTQAYGSLANLQIENGTAPVACTPDPNGYTSSACASGQVCVTDQSGQTQYYCRARCNPGSCGNNEVCTQRYTIPDPMGEFPTPVYACVPTSVEPYCDPSAYWKQELELCVARHYLEFAEATAPYGMYFDFKTTPLGRTLDSDAQGGTTYPAHCESGIDSDPDDWCQSDTLAILPASEAASTRRIDRLTAGWNTYHDTNAAQSGTGTSAELGESLEDFLAFMTRPVAQWPVQAPPDQASLALLAINHFQAAMETGANYIDCVLKHGQPYRIYTVSEGGPVRQDLTWVDTYDHRAFPINELVVTNNASAMQEMLEAKDLALEQIVAAADQRLGDNPDPREQELRWRGQVNSRLEAIHVLSSLSSDLFQAEDATEEDVKASRTLYPVLTMRPSGEVAAAVQTLREARVDPRVVLEPAGITALEEATSVAIRSKLPYYDSTLSAGDIEPRAVLQRNAGIGTEALRTAAYYLVDEARVLGRPIVETGHPIAVAQVPDGPSNDTDALGLFAVTGTESGRAMHPQVLYARTIGNGANDLKRGTELKADGETAQKIFPFYDGVYGAVAMNGAIFGRLNRNLTFNPASPDHFTPGTFTYERFFPAASTRPAHTTAVASTDDELATLMQSNLSLAHVEVEGVVADCAAAQGVHTLYLLSGTQQNSSPEVWKNEDGLECALSGSLGDAPCDESDFRVNTTFDPTGWRDSRTIPPFYEVPGIDFGALMSLAPYYATDALAGGLIEAAGANSVAVTAGDRVYFTRVNSRGAREAFLGLTLQYTGPLPGLARQCIFHPYGGDVTAEMTEAGEPDEDHPDDAKICCEGLPCDLKVPLEDSLQTTPPREVESSFMHYLTLAREAATRADDLGDELYRQGLEMDLRAEAAREELEQVCGGVQNVEQLNPVSCSDDGDCCGLSSPCPLHCQKFDPSSSSMGRCVAENLADGLATGERFFCHANADCMMGQACVGEGDARVCAATCPSGTCSGSNVCVESASSGSPDYCAPSCDFENCPGGFRCVTLTDDSGSNMSYCTPDSKQDLSSLNQCLGVGDDRGTGAPIGTQVLCAWREGSKPLCACDSVARTDCPASFDDSGQPTCPVFATGKECQESDFDTALGGDAHAFFTNGRDLVPLDSPLGFSVDPQQGGATATPGICDALAQLRSSAGTEAERSAIAARVLQQAWMQRAGFVDFAESLDVDMDVLGFLTITRNGQPWLSTGSEASGPASGGFPAVPRTIDPDPLPDEPPIWLCADTADNGTALRCQCSSEGCSPRLSGNHLQRLVNTIQVMSGMRRVTVAGVGEWERHVTTYQNGSELVRWSLTNDDDHVVHWSEETFQPFASPFFDTAPSWITGLSGNDAATVKIPSATDLTTVRGEQHLEGQDGDVEYQIDYRNAHCYSGLTTVPNGARNPVCPAALNDPWRQAYRIRADSGDETDNHQSDPVFGSDNTSPYIWNYVSGSSSTTDDVQHQSERVLFQPVGDRTLSSFLRQMAEDPLPGDAQAPILREGWKLGGKTPTVNDVMDALELVCIAHAEPQVGTRGCPTTLTELPQVTSAKDFPKLVDFLECAAERLDGQLDRMWIPDLPKSLATAIAAGQVTGTFPTYRGTYGASIAALQGELAAIPTSIRTITSQVRDFAGELRQTQWAIEKLENESAILDWRMVADISSQVTECALAGADTAKNITSFGSSGAIACANSLVQIASLINVHALQESNLKIDQKQALQGLALNFATRMDQVAGAGDRLNVAYTEITRLVSELDQQRAEATRAAAKMQFLDSDSTGRVYNVNTVMRRRMNTLRVRYAQALKDAKQMAFIARRSVEQRLAIDLATDDFPELLLVDPPNTWVDKACQMTGIDYDRIRDSGTSPVANTLDDNFSAGYIGDYVTKLENFVESYRFNYPFQDGHDVAILSVRDDLKHVTAPCVVEGPNLLYQASNPAIPRGDGDVGWEDLSDDGRAVTFLSAGVSPTQPDADGDSGFFAGGQAVRMSPAMSAPDTAGESAWGQAVPLDVGVYLLTWYEQGACPAPEAGPGLGVSVTGLQDPTSVRVFDVGQVPVGDFVPEDDWCRWQLPIELDVNQDVLVRFALTDDEEITWAQPQLEAARNVELDGTEPTADPALDFFPTTDVLTAEGGACEDTSGAVFRGQWAGGESFCEPVCAGDLHGCANFDPDDATAFRCYREIHFSIGAGDIENGGFSSLGGVAPGSFNYRVSRLGINLVGTGLRDCSQSPFPSSCYSGGFVQYSLYHDGEYAVTNHTGGVHDVALFPGRIEHAKALAAERMLTNPLSSADRELMDSYWREEFRGRPLQGSYTLRVYDIDGGNGTSVLNWDALEDVQLMVEYNYWTRAE